MKSKDDFWRSSQEETTDANVKTCEIWLGVPSEWSGFAGHSDEEMSGKNDAKKTVRHTPMNTTDRNLDDRFDSFPRVNVSGCYREFVVGGRRCSNEPSFSLWRNWFDLIYFKRFGEVRLPFQLSLGQLTINTVALKLHSAVLLGEWRPWELQFRASKGLLPRLSEWKVNPHSTTLLRNAALKLDDLDDGGRWFNLSFFSLHDTDARMAGRLYKKLRQSSKENKLSVNDGSTRRSHRVVRHSPDKQLP